MGGRGGRKQNKNTGELIMCGFRKVTLKNERNSNQVIRLKHHRLYVCRKLYKESRTADKNCRQNFF